MVLMVFLRYRFCNDLTHYVYGYVADVHLMGLHSPCGAFITDGIYRSVAQASVRCNGWLSHQ
jgi:hypothetical protein